VQPGLGEGLGTETASSGSRALIGKGVEASLDERGQLLPTDLDALSTDELLGLLFDERVRTALAQRGIALRRHLMRCLRLVQLPPPPTSLASVYRQTDAGVARTERGTAPRSRDEEVGGSDMRADAPSFVPFVPDFVAVPTPELKWAFFLSNAVPIYQDEELDEAAALAKATMVAAEPSMPATPVPLVPLGPVEPPRGREDGDMPVLPKDSADLVWNPAELDWKNKCLLRSQAVANALRNAARHAGRLPAGH